MVSIKEAISDTQKCVKEGNPLNKCLAETKKKYNLDQKQLVEVRKAFSKPKPKGKK